jgi:IS1 family transposase
MAIQENLVRGLNVKDLQLDEIWSFIGAKQKTINQQNEGYDEKVGSAYTFTCIDSDSKMIVAWHLGKRSLQDTEIFLDKVYHAVDNGTDNRYQVSTDAFRGYEHSVNEILGARADYGQIIKLYSKPNPKEVRYSAGDCIGIKKRVICGNPDKEKISTSFVERSNLTVRMSIRRFTRLTNAFSKKWENHNYALALFFTYYNFVRPHKALNGATPAMAAGISKTFWTLKELIGIESEKAKSPSNPY